MNWGRFFREDECSIVPYPLRRKLNLTELKGKLMKNLTIAILVVFSGHAFGKNSKDLATKFVPGELIVKLRSSNKAVFKSLEDQGITVKRPIKLSYDTLYVLDIGKNKSLKSTIISHV